MRFAMSLRTRFLPAVALTLLVASTLAARASTVDDFTFTFHGGQDVATFSLPTTAIPFLQTGDQALYLQQVYLNGTPATSASEYVYTNASNDTSVESFSIDIFV